MRNGTQEELDAAREDADLLPWDVFFVSKAATTIGMNVKRMGHVFDDKYSVAFISADESKWDFYDYRELGVIND